MTFIDLFAGIGGMRRGMELAGHRCVGFCEWDKFATASYTSMHLITEEQRAYLATLDLKKRQKEILKDEYRNGEWYSPDIRQVGAGNVPRCDCWCFGAPCQDFSVAGKRAGLDGDRSSLIREVFRVLGELEEKDRPEWLIYENVKGMLSSNRGGDFLSIILAMEELGYDIEWFTFNSKYHGVPQNRERVYTLGHLRRCGRRKVFPICGTVEEDSNDIKQIGKYDSARDNANNFRTYDKEGIVGCLSCMGGENREPHTAIPMCVGGIDKGNKKFGKQFAQQDRVYDGCQVATSLTSQLSGNVNNYAIPLHLEFNKGYNQKNVVHTAQEECRTLTGQGHGGLEPKGAMFGIDYSINNEERDIANTLTTRNNTNGVSNVKQDETAVCIPILTPDRSDKRQNGRRMKDNGEDSFTLTAQDRHGVGIGVNTEIDGTSRTIKAQYAKNSLANFIRTDSLGATGAMQINCQSIPCIWYDKYNCYIAIRKLTPKECFRLQGWTDDYFEKAQFVNSDSQLYKQVGNGVTVNVVYEIAKAMGGTT